MKVRELELQKLTLTKSIEPNEYDKRISVAIYYTYKKMSALNFQDRILNLRKIFTFINHSLVSLKSKLKYLL